MRVILKRLELKNYIELHEKLVNEKNSDLLAEIIGWLEKGQFYDKENRSYNPLIKRKKRIRDYTVQMPKIKKNKKRKRKFVLKPDFDFGVKPLPDPENIELVKDFLANQNVNYQAYKPNYFSRRVQARMRRLDIETYANYAKFLQKVPQEKNELIDTFSINVTHFFRDKDLFSALEKTHIPSILSKSHKTKIWSAGSAVGCEPYSLAIVIKKIEKFSMKNSIRILATDLSQEFLEQAREGIYEKEAGFFKEVDALELQTFFSQLRPGLFRIIPEIQRMVEFKNHDLRTMPPESNFDLILCRNVLIYFSRSQSKLLFERFHAALNVGGLLAIGKCELINPHVRDRFETIDAQNRIYRKVE